MHSLDPAQNSNVHKSRATLAVDIAREKDLDAKRALKRQRAEAKLAMKEIEERGEMLVEETAGACVAS